MTKNVISIDLEDWYHSGYLRNYAIKPESQLHLSVPPILKLLKKYNTNATFFVLGDVAEKSPEIIEMICKEGHEIASHGFSHKEIWKLSKEGFVKEIERTEKAINKITKEKIIGFRAPLFSLSKETAWFLEELKKKEYKYDSSLFSMKTPLYGCANAKRIPYRVSTENFFLEDKNSDFIECPLTIFKMGFNFPLGGFYLRLVPFFIFKHFLRKAKKNKTSSILFFHNWEAYKGTIRLKVPLKSRFITYYRINKMLDKIEYMIKNYKFTSFRENLDNMA